jgi:DNA repair exonuclease SbcCD ATPase subunit
MWKLAFENIAGIRSGTATISEGRNVVQASNFAGKSSFVHAVQTVMGTTGRDGRPHPLTEGADEGTVALEGDGASYEVTLERAADGTVVRHGTGYIEDDTDRECARLFAFLGENNPIRARVRNEQELTDLLQAPLDIEDIETRIDRLRSERESVTSRLESAEQATDTLPSVQETIRRLEDDLETLRERRAEIADRVGDTDSESRALSDELAERRSDLHGATQTVSRLRKQLERKETRLAEKREELDRLDVPEEPSASTDIADREARIETLERQLDLLEGLHRANRRVLEADEVQLVADVDSSLAGDEFDCWVCGETTTRDDVEERLAALQDRITTLRTEKTALSEAIEERRREQRRIRNERRRKEQIEERVGTLAADVDELRGDLRQAEEREAELSGTVETLEERVEQAETELNEDLTDIKAALRTKESELDEQRARLAELRETGQKATELRERKDRLSEEIEGLRNRKKQTQWEIKEEFDTAMQEAIERFAPGFDGARFNVVTTPDNDIERFELIVARDGRETVIDNLSEGERELVGIVVAVAGYRAFDVAERVPVVLLDGISQLSADNLERLADYLDDAGTTLVTTAYPEAGDIGGAVIDPADWDTVSDEETPAP